MKPIWQDRIANDPLPTSLVTYNVMTNILIEFTLWNPGTNNSVKRKMYIFVKMSFNPKRASSTLLIVYFHCGENAIEYFADVARVINFNTTMKSRPKL